MIESKRLKSTAIQKPLTPNPSTKASTKSIITALITIRKRPRVIIVTGSVKSTSTGFTIRLSSARTRATTIAVTYPVTVTPGRKLARNTTTTAVKRILKRKVIVFLFNTKVSTLNEKRRDKPGVNNK